MVVSAWYSREPLREAESKRPEPIEPPREILGIKLNIFDDAFVSERNDALVDMCFVC
jgi:hypothetical protein